VLLYIVFNYLKGFSGGQTGRPTPLILKEKEQIKPFKYNRLRQLV